MQRTCYRCGTVDPYPVLLRIIAQNSGPGGGIYACPACAQREYRTHHQMCHICGAGQRCQSSSELRASILEARRQRLAGSGS